MSHLTELFQFFSSIICKLSITASWVLLQMLPLLLMIQRRTGGGGGDGGDGGRGDDGGDGGNGGGVQAV